MAYNVLSKKWHPDANSAGLEQTCDSMMQLLNTALETLLDDKKRELYDEKIGMEKTSKDFIKPNEGKEKNIFSNSVPYSYTYFPYNII